MALAASMNESADSSSALSTGESDCDSVLLDAGGLEFHRVPGAFHEDGELGDRPSGSYGDHARDCNGQSEDDRERIVYNNRISALRPDEFPQLAPESLYLDHAGTTIPSRSLIAAFAEASMNVLLGNPHSGSAGGASQAAARKVEDVRLKALQWFNADPNEFDLIFVANATAGIKLVGEGLRGYLQSSHGIDKERKGAASISFRYHADAHTSIVGLREEFTGLERCEIGCLESDEDVQRWFHEMRRNWGERGQSYHGRSSLFAYPAQSNMDGRQLPLSWVSTARSLGIYTLLDAAALVPTSPLDLSNAENSPDFTVLSFYKMFGMPDLGALIVKKTAGDLLRHKRYFGGGTVETVSVLGEQWHIRKQCNLNEILEDGTLPIHNIAMLDIAFDSHKKLFTSILDVKKHTTWLSGRLRDELSALRHWNGHQVCRLYSGTSGKLFGPTVAFNILDSRGFWASNFEVEKLASVRNVQIRTGGVCNPGGIANALRLSPWEMQANFSSGRRCGGENDVMNGKPTGIIRLSLGAMSTLSDVHRFMDFMNQFFVERQPPKDGESQDMLLSTVDGFVVESLTVYPIKSCAGWSVPPDVAWSVRAEGLAWDREWCLVHQGTRAALSQKKYTKMALLRPRLDLSQGLLVVKYHGPSLSGLAFGTEVSIPISMDPLFYERREGPYCSSAVCGDEIRMHVCSSEEINSFFSCALGVPCQLARYLPSSNGASVRHAKPHLLGTRKNSNTTLLLSNESPILIVSRSSLNRLNETIKSSSPPGRAAPAAVFRANIVISENRKSGVGFEQPWIEDHWETVTITPGPDRGRQSEGKNSSHEIPTGQRRCYLSLDVLGPCRRCQMVCIDQESGEKSQTGEPFISLARTRRWDGKVWFGIHATPADLSAERRIMVGDNIRATVRH